MNHPYFKIHCSIPVLFDEGVMCLTAANMHLEYLRAKAAPEFNRRLKRWVEKVDVYADALIQGKEREAIKIEPAPLLEFNQAEEPVICRRMTREEFEAEYG